MTGIEMMNKYWIYAKLRVFFWQISMVVKTHLTQIYNCDGDDVDVVDDHQHHHHRDHVEDGDDCRSKRMWKCVIIINVIIIVIVIIIMVMVVMLLKQEDVEMCWWAEMRLHMQMLAPSCGRWQWSIYSLMNDENGWLWWSPTAVKALVWNKGTLLCKIGFNRNLSF